MSKSKNKVRELTEAPEVLGGPEVHESTDVHEAPEMLEVIEVLEVTEVLDATESPDALAQDAPAPESPALEAPAPEAPEVVRMELSQLKAVIEALMFASPDPLTPRMLYKLLNDEPKEDVKAALEALRADYADRGGMHIAEVAGGFQITTRPEYHEWVRRLFHERSANKLSVAALETLSVIAYKQPVTAAEIGEIRSVNTSGVLSTLLERHLIKIVGRKNVIGRPFLYGTTKEFLIRFGLNDLGDLPKIEDMAQQLGFEPPSVLMERPVPEEMLPLDEGDVPEGSPE
jgi:segregation and condensation protein B